MLIRRPAPRITTSSSSLVADAGVRTFPTVPELIWILCAFATEGTLASLARVSKDISFFAIEALYTEVVIVHAVSPALESLVRKKGDLRRCML